MADSPETSRDPAAAGKGLFDFSFGTGTGGDRSGHSIGDIWNMPSFDQSGTQSGPSTRPWFPTRELLTRDEPSPAVVRTRQGSHALKRRSGAATSSRMQIQKSLSALDEVVGSTSPSAPLPSLMTHTPKSSSLLKESLLRSATGRLSDVATPPGHTPTTQQFDTPKQFSLSIMDETGMTRELLLAPTPSQDVTYLGSPSEITRTRGNLTFLDTTLFGTTPGGVSVGGRDSSLLEDPIEKTSRVLVNSFHESYSTYSTYSSSADVLHLARALEKSCDDQLTQLKDTETHMKGSHLPQLVMELNLERSTWQLLYALYTDRVETESSADDEDMITDIMMKGQNDKEIAAEYFVKDSEVRQAQLVVDWLEQNAQSNLERYPVKVNYFADNVNWENTLHCLRNKIDTGRIVTEMDPDAPTRSGRHLAELDEKDEQSLVRHLFTCIRAGQLSEAQELCVKCGQAWRAATLEGWKLYNDPNYGKDVQREELESVEGNFTRDLWKISCWEMAKDPDYSAHEKAIYAALSGNIKQILPACNSWFDYVWAYFKVMVDVLTEKKLRSCSPTTGQEMENMPPEYWDTVLIPEIIFQEIESSPSVVIRKECQNHFHIVHKHIILDDLNGLVCTMHEWLKDGPNIYKLRFMAHLVLFAEGLGRSIEEDKSKDILEAYAKELIQMKFNTLVALYVSRLSSDHQVNCYAQLLEGIEDPIEQKQCLDLGKEAGLNVAIITKSVVEHIRNTGVDDLDSTTLDVGKLSEVPEITKLDHSKIEVIKWLVFDESQREEAIRQGNALMRQFLGTKKYKAARNLLRKLPADSIEVVNRNWQMMAGDAPLPVNTKNDLHEFHCIQAYLDGNEAFSRWFKHFHQNKPEPPPAAPVHAEFRDSVAYDHKFRQFLTEEQNWRTQLHGFTEEAETNLYNVLLYPGGWLVDDSASSPVDERRSHQLNFLREICLPQVCFLLHTVLHSTEQYRKCLSLADIIASEEYRLYQVFQQHELKQLLSLLHKSACSTLDDRQSELGYPL